MIPHPQKKQWKATYHKVYALGLRLIMNEEMKFGELTSQELNIGDIVEWSNWNDVNNNWDVKYGIITDVTNEIKAGRFVSVSKVIPINGPNAEMEFFTLSLKVVSHSKREELENEAQS